MDKMTNLVKDTCIPSDKTGAGLLVGLNAPRFYSISKTKIPQFWTGYNLLFQNGSTDLTIRELPGEDSPIMVHIRLRFSSGDDLYDDDLLYSLCSCYQEAMSQLLDIDSEEAYHCVVLESEGWEDEKKNRCVDIELRFPNCRVNCKFQSKELRDKAIEIIRQRNIMQRFPVQPLDDWRDNIIEDFVLKPIPLIGSVESKNQSPLKPARYYGRVREEDDEPQELELETMFDPSKHIHYAKGLIKQNIFSHEDYDSPIFWLPYYLSVGYGQEVTLPKSEVHEESKSVVSAEGDETDLEIANHMLTILQTVDISDNEWLDIGKVIYNLEEGNNNGLQSWQNFTKKKKPHLLPTCELQYSNFRHEKNYLTCRTLGYLARAKANNAYNEWHNSYVEPTLKKALSATHTDVANALYRFYWLDYTCARDKKKWYHFDKHRWHRIGEGLELKHKISTEFVKAFENMRARLSQHIFNSADPNAKEKGEGGVKAITELIKKLKNQTYKSTLMKEAIEVFSVYESFEDILDHNVNLLGLRNGVVEISGDKATFRGGRPEDFISKCTNIYFVDYTKKEEKDGPMDKLKDWLRKAFPHDDMHKYFLKFAASCLKGGNDDKIFPIFTGEGNNSKSMIVKLFECTFGSYCIKFPITLLTGKRTGSSSATPELARARAARVAFLDEPGGDETIGNGQLKANTGGDSFYARGLHEEGKEIKATYKLIMQCNAVPQIPHADKATKNRSRLFPFVSTWAATGVPDDEKEQMEKRLFKMIPNFDQQIPSMASAFLWLMMEYYPLYKKEGLNTPEIVMKETDEYWKETDVYVQFTTDIIETAYKEEVKGKESEPDPNVKLTLSEVYAEFKPWYRENFPGLKPPDRAVVKKELCSRWGRMAGNNWLGIRIKDVSVVNLANVK